MNTENNIRNDANSAISDVNRLKKELLEFEELHQIESTLNKLESPLAEDLDEFKTRAAELLDRIYEILNQINNAPIQIRSPADLLPLSTFAQELKILVEYLEGVLSRIEVMIVDSSPLSGWVTQSLQSPLKKALSKIKSYLLPFIKKFLSKLWSIISGLMNPKEWKLKGKVGTGILGLADVEVEVTFGP